MINLPSRLEELTKDDNVLTEEEIKTILKNNCLINKRDHNMVLSLLKRFKILRKISYGKNGDYYVIGKKKDEKIEEFNIEKKRLNMMLLSMKKTDENLTKEVAQLKKDHDQAKLLKSPKIKMILISFTAKIKTLKALRGRIMLMTQRIGQFNNAQTDIEMGNLLKNSNKILEEGAQDSLDVLKDAIHMGTQMEDMQNSINNILHDNTDMDDIEKMFNNLNDSVSIPEEISNKINEELTNSGIITAQGNHSYLI